MSDQPTTPFEQPTTVNTASEPRRVRVSTVIWGFILIVVALLFLGFAQFDLSGLNAGAVIAWTVIGIGVIAILGGIIAAIARKP